MSAVKFSSRRRRVKWVGPHFTRTLSCLRSKQTRQRDFIHPAPQGGSEMIAAFGFPNHLNQFALLRNADSLSTLRGSVRRGSDSPPGCHSLPRRALHYPQGEALEILRLHSLRSFRSCGISRIDVSSLSWDYEIDDG